jgi:large conductance mechanosensitive channel
MLKEFKQFIMTGNVLDLAIAVILAGAVGTVVNGFVVDIMMPFIGYFTGGVDFSQITIELSKEIPAVIGPDAVETTPLIPANVIRIGKWINTIINLIIVGFVLFMIIKASNKMKKKKEEAPAAPPTPSNQEVLLSEIRDLLKK